MALCSSEIKLAKLLLLGITGAIALDWCYDNPTCGPATWPGLCQSGQSQSPIDIVPEEMTKAQLPAAPLIFSKEYFKVMDFDIVNVGKGVQLKPHIDTSLANPPKLRIKGEGLNGTFSLNNLYFRWGSQHTINGVRYPLELVLASQQLAPGNLYGQVSILYAISKKPNKALSPIVAQLPKVVTGNTTALVKMPSGFNVSSLFPPVWDIFRYRGSLIIPNCTEGVLWNIFTQRMPISQGQLDEFTNSRDPKGNVLKKVYRDVQFTLTKQRKKVFWLHVDKTKSKKLAF